jgi:Secretion system C-terminal sorting domain
MPNPEDRELLLSNIFKWFGAVTDITPIPNQKTEVFSLSQNYPNPFNPMTQICFGLPKSIVVRIEIFNVLGQKVSVLMDGKRPAGQHMVEFDGSRFASGVYFYRIKAGDFVDVKKMVLMR